MRRVVVTGLGIVSSIGHGAEEVTQSLREARSGVVHAPDHAKDGFRSQVWAPPKIGPWEELVDRRAARSLANGTAWGHIAFAEALKSSGMTAEEIRDDRIGLIVGEGGPSTQVIVEAGASAEHRGRPNRIGTFAVPNAMASGPVGQAGRGLRRRLRGHRLVHVEPVRRHGRHVVELQRDPLGRLARL
mgnify:CR=1 FL=1